VLYIYLYLYLYLYLYTYTYIYIYTYIDYFFVASYDYGMRAVMAVLRAAVNRKREFPEENENVLMHIYIHIYLYLYLYTYSYIYISGLSSFQLRLRHARRHGRAARGGQPEARIP